MPVDHAADRLRPGDLDEIVRVLDGSDAEAQCRALTLLCPCRNRVYAVEVWKRIFRARESRAPGVRDRASHAIGTLLERAAGDPRAWELLLRLEEEMGGDLRGGIPGIAWWGPRHRPGRRKRMTFCKTGRLKALASTQLRTLRPAGGEARGVRD